MLGPVWARLVCWKVGRQIYHPPAEQDWPMPVVHHHFISNSWSKTGLLGVVSSTSSA